MKTSLLNLSWKKLGTAITLSLVSLFATNQTALSSEMLDIIQEALQQGETIVVRGLFDDDSYYTIDGFTSSFADKPCVGSICEYTDRYVIYDLELIRFLADACYNQVRFVLVKV